MLLGVQALALAGIAGTGMTQVPEDELKAAFIFNFAAFVVWPDDFRPGDLLTMCVRSGDALQAALSGLEGRVIDGRPVTVRRLASIEDVAGCRIIIVDPERQDTSAKVGSVMRPVSESDREDDWPSGWWRRPGVLSVATSGDSAWNGTVVTLVRERTRVRFDIDGDAAGRVDLTLSSKLLRLARRVR